MKVEGRIREWMSPESVGEGKMLDKSAFLKKYNIPEESLSKSTCNWDDLNAIYDDFCSKEQELHVAGNQILERLRLIKEVHSLKIRIKNPEHLIEKIIRKKEENPERKIGLENYVTEITDLIGLRALHLFKDDWINIHRNIIDIWPLHEKPIAYIRTGDSEKDFTDNGCEVRPHESGYRSVHYLIKSQPTKILYIAEIQVRTIFEEGWSEIDHRLRYPYDINNTLLSEYLRIFNRLAGSADEMGSYIKFLKSALTEREAKYEEEREQFNNEKENILTEMEKLKGKLKSEANEKEELQKIIDSLKKSNAPLYDLTNIGKSLGSQLENYTKLNEMYSPILQSFPNIKTCAACGLKYTIPRGLASVASRSCPNCGTLNI